MCYDTAHKADEHWTVGEGEQQLDTVEQTEVGLHFHITIHAT